MKNILAENSTILLIDDEIDILEFTKEAISPFFQKILVAHNGEEACEVLKTHKVDLIVTDYYMPKIDGLKLIELVKQNHPFIPIIMLTSNGNDPEVLLALQKGVFDILDKPFKMQVLINRIQNGLLFPECIKIIWSIMSKDFSLPLLEDFLRKPLDEQHNLIYAYGSVIQMKSLIQKDSEDE